MTVKNVIVRTGTGYRRRIQIPSGHGHVPRYRNMIATVGGKKTAFRHVRRRYERYRKIGVFEFKITRDDGTVIDETSLRYYGQGINIYQKKDEYPNPTEVWHLRMVGSAHGRDGDDPDDLQYWTKTGDIWNYYNDEHPDYITEFSYNTVSQIWTVPFYTWQTVKRNEPCFVRFICDEDSITAWYKKPTGEDPKYVYKTADLFKDEDLIKPKFYEIAVPYWNIRYEYNKPTYEEWAGWGGLDCEEKFAGLAGYPHFYWDAPGDDFYRYTSLNNFYKKITVKSSVPYKVTERLQPNDRYITSFGYDPEGVIGSFWGTKPCPELSALCISYGATARFHGEKLDVTYTTIDPPSNWDEVIEEYEVEPTIGGRTFTINADLTADPDITYYSYCHIWTDPLPNFYEHWATNITWHRFSTNRKEISTFINITANYNY